RAGRRPRDRQAERGRDRQLRPSDARSYLACGRGGGLRLRARGSHKTEPLTKPNRLLWSRGLRWLLIAVPLLLRVVAVSAVAWLASASLSGSRQAGRPSSSLSGLRSHRRVLL